MADAEPPYQLVVIGSSAGGIDALSTLVAGLPTAFPAPIVVAQHLDPRRPSHLSDILQRRTSLPVEVVEGPTPLRSGVVYVIPANHHVEISDHEVAIQPAADVGPRPSVDHLLETAASVFGETLIAVILSGTGSDGAEGARQVKSMGGTVIVQNPETAAYPGMPQSLAPTTVDIVADVEAIGPLLADLLHGKFIHESPDEERLLRSFLNDLRERTGIDFASYKRPTISRRLQRRMAATGAVRLRDYMRYVKQHPEEYERLTSAFLIKVTEFFRDPELFDYLRDEILPRLIAAAQERPHELRIWSAGCATGEEAYSLAILLSEVLGDNLDRIDVRVFATDLDTDAINFARRGIYPPSALARLSPELIEKYFIPSNGEYEIKKAARALTVFGQHDLGQRAPFPRIDLALCRNVLIYFTAELQKRALQLFAFSLRDDGYLVLGKAETTSPLSEHFVLENSHLRVYRRQGSRVLIPPARIRDSAPIPIRLAAKRGSGGPDAGTRLHRDPRRAPTGAETAQRLLQQLPVGVIRVDETYDIHLVNAAARRMLGIHSAAIGHDLVHLASRLPSNALRKAIDRAFQGEASTQRLEVRRSDAAEPSWLELICDPAGDEGVEGESRMVTVSVVDVSELARENRDRARDLEQERTRSGQLASALAEAREDLGGLLLANQELASANEELRSGNEALLVANEEVQAATEEVETLNEELQATNEELETLNEELQATVEELNTTNDDLQARSGELQESAVSLDRQRRVSEVARTRLEAVLREMPTPVLVLDAKGERLLVNAAYEAAFPAEASVSVDGAEPSGGAAALETALAGRSETRRVRVEGESGASGWVVDGVPIRMDGHLVGTVVTARPAGVSDAAEASRA